MHPSLTSREQDLAAMPKHQALLKNLGIGPLLKSQVHADAFRSLLRQDGNDSHAAPSNPMKMFRSKDSTLTPSQNAAHERLRKQEYRDAEKLRRMSESRANGGISTDEEAERGYTERKTALERKQAASAHANRGGNGGAFSRLKKTLQEHLSTQGGASMAKAVGHEHGQSFEERYGTRAEPIQRARVASVAAPKQTASQSLQKAMGRVQGLLKSMDIAPAGSSSLEAGYATDSADLTGGSALRRQSLDKSRVFGTTVAGDAVAAPKLTPAMIERAASKALAAGQITGAEANQIATYCAMDAICPEPLLKRLRGE